MSVEWTKYYELKTDKNENFKIFISNRGNSEFYASCMYYEGKRMLSSPDKLGGGLKFDLKTVSGRSLEEVNQQIKVWAIEKFGEKISITERTSSGPFSV